MLIVGLTGSIGMGKSETARMFRRLGVPVYDADAAVHEVYAKGGRAVEPVEAAFPGVSRDGAINREELGKRVLGDAQALRKLEAIVHPLVGELQREFMERAEAEGAPIVVLDIPLLFETGRENAYDVVVVVSAPYKIQRQRVLERPGMTEEKFRAILEKQVPDADKRARADYVVDSGKGLEHAFEQVKAIVAELKARAAANCRQREEKTSA